MASKNSYEMKIKELEALVEKLEEGQLSLEENLKLYENGVKLTNELYKILTKAEGKITILTDGEEKEFKINEE
ncbi:exodeoxyribonuclease VII small subunit [Clostridium cellulovorans]|uniref:Exodeoxyribonuclease 7 small subunit n=1 Tax=Clostridium cellulovorans (strain ATCC 35296 / DSM 3052 / OCM 3 / 743B) TaxID=573061 RepID=D9SLU8_CLOC7|nr:exodeoxyribonuclease VII small subunit [Clostridium cellulovorans]ADL51679.1 Exonuclease VII small subunit [Clostridium cellulovorans 743B]